tara:strand:+ start:1084 stop:2859 length:1776 start_codon:yes stop_codon:yes gene_type:complete
MLLPLLAKAQVGIGTSNPSSATLLQVGEINASGGFLLPKINLPSIGSRGPITGTMVESLLIYNTNTSLAGGKGFYYWREGSTSWDYFSTGTNNVYTKDGALPSDRIITANGNTFSILSDFGQSSFILKKATPTAEIGLGLRNSGNFYDATFTLGSGNNAPLTLYTGLNQRFADDLEPSLILNNDRSINFPGYGGIDNTKDGASTLTHYLGINGPGNLVKIEAALSSAVSNNDWYVENTTAAPTSIDQNIYTNGNVAINRMSALGTLNVYDPSSAVAGFNSGTVLLERNDNTENSIVFTSAVNRGSDSGYIRYYPSSSDGTGARNVLELGTTNDTPNTNFQDDININSSGSLGINNNTPSISASIDMGRTNQGIKVNKVSLTGALDTDTVIGTEQNGLLVYNTANAGSGTNAVTEGFYYWYNSKWNPIKTTNSTPSTGLQYYSYNITQSKSPDLFTIETENPIAKSGYYGGNLTANQNTGAFVTMKPSNDNGFIIKMTGSLYANNNGVFNFNVAADDGYRIYVDGSLIVNFWDDATGGNDNVASGGINLKKGKHKIVIYYFQYQGPRRFTFSWGSNPDGKTGTIKATDFFVN